MTHAIRRIPFRALGTTSEVHVRYLEEDHDLEPFLGRRARSAQELLASAPVRARRLVPPKALSEALLAYAERHGAPAPVLENARAIADGETVAVVTGQQPGLLGGPLFTIHKAATAVRLARELSALPGAPRVVPLFWNHSDDHDLDEANRAFAVNQNLDLQRIRLDLPYAGTALHDVPVARAMEPALAALRDVLPETEFRQWAFGLVEPKAPSDTFATIQTRLLLALLGQAGLLVIEPRDLPPAAFEVLPRWCQGAEKIRGVTRTAIEELADVGIDSTLDPQQPLMFQDTGQRRVPLSEDSALPRATALSPGALLRPLWEDACLPTVALVVGPGELAYLAVAGPLYKHLGVPAPVLVPRASMTLVEPSLQKLLQRFAWDLPDLVKGPEVLARNLDEGSGSAVEEGLEELAGQVKKRMAELGVQLKKVDSQMVGPMERARGKLVEELVKLAARLRRNRQNREGTGTRQVRRLCSWLRPAGRLQERVLGPLPFLVSHGEALTQAVLDAADPFATEHGVVEL